MEWSIPTGKFPGKEHIIDWLLWTIQHLLQCISFNGQLTTNYRETVFLSRKFLDVMSFSQLVAVN